MIRPATVSDIPRLLEMGERFAERAKLGEHIGYDPESMAATFRFLLASPEGCIFISEDGAVGGTRDPHPFNLSCWVASELFWWSEGRGGLRLLQTFEDWAREKCRVVHMLTLEAVNAERVGRIYEKRGYAPVERGYMKVL